MDADELGRQRQAVHKDSKNPRMRPDELDYEHKVGGAGEDQFTKEFGYPYDSRKLPNGDDGYDFVTPIGLIDVKATRFDPPALNVKVYEIDRKLDFYLLAYQDANTMITEFLGWEWHDAMRDCPIVQLNYGRCYQKQPKDLQPMDLFRGVLAYREEMYPDLTVKLKAAKWPNMIKIYEDWLNGKI